METDFRQLQRAASAKLDIFDIFGFLWGTICTTQGDINVNCMAQETLIKFSTKLMMKTTRKEIEILKGHGAKKTLQLKPYSQPISGKSSCQFYHFRSEYGHSHCVMIE